VRLVCADRSRLTNVTDAGNCTFMGILATPAVCSAEKVAEARELGFSGLIHAMTELGRYRKPDKARKRTKARTPEPSWDRRRRRGGKRTTIIRDGKLIEEDED
jgi:hypothetical protein